MNDVIFSPLPIDELVDRIIQRMNNGVTKHEISEPLQDETGIDGAIQMTGYRKSTIYRMSMNGTIPCSKMGKRLLFSRKDLQEWMRYNSVQKSGISSRVLNSISEAASSK